MSEPLNPSRDLPALTGEHPISLRPDALPYMSTIPDDHPDRETLIHAALTGSQPTTLDAVGATIKVANVVVSVGEYADELSGEIRYARRIVMISPDGAMTTSTSDSVWRSLRVAASLFGPPPWQPPREFRIVQHSSKRGPRKYITLELIP